MNDSHHENLPHPQLPNGSTLFDLDEQHRLFAPIPSPNLIVQILLPVPQDALSTLTQQVRTFFPDRIPGDGHSSEKQDTQAFSIKMSIA